MTARLKTTARRLQTAVGMSEAGYPIIPTLTLAFNRLSIPEKQTGLQKCPAIFIWKSIDNKKLRIMIKEANNRINMV